jgi:hypothetical protein
MVEQVRKDKKSEKRKIRRNTKKTVSGRIEVDEDFSAVIDSYFWKMLKKEK